MSSCAPVIQTLKIDIPKISSASENEKNQTEIEACKKRRDGTLGVISKYGKMLEDKILKTSGKYEQPRATRNVYFVFQEHPVYKPRECKTYCAKSQSNLYGILNSLDNGFLITIEGSDFANRLTKQNLLKFFKKYNPQLAKKQNLENYLHKAATMSNFSLSKLFKQQHLPAYTVFSFLYPKKHLIYGFDTIKPEHTINIFDRGALRSYHALAYSLQLSYELIEKGRIQNPDIIMIIGLMHFLDYEDLLQKRINWKRVNDKAVITMHDGYEFQAFTEEIYQKLEIIAPEIKTTNFYFIETN